jgi:hypothetical protein
MVIMAAAAPALALSKAVIIPIAHGSKRIFTGQPNTGTEQQAARAKETATGGRAQADEKPETGKTRPA